MAEFRKIDIALARQGDEFVRCRKDGSYDLRVIYDRQEIRKLFSVPLIKFEVSDSDEPVLYYLEEYPDYAWEDFLLLVDKEGRDVDLVWVYTVRPGDTLLMNKRLYKVHSAFYDENKDNVFVTSDDELLKPLGDHVIRLKPKSKK